MRYDTEGEGTQPPAQGPDAVRTPRLAASVNHSGAGRTVMWTQHCSCQSSANQRRSTTWMALPWPEQQIRPQEGRTLRNGGLIKNYPILA